jgi:hypothetical protein
MRARHKLEISISADLGRARHLSPFGAIANLGTFVLAWQRHVDIAQSRAGWCRRCAPLLPTSPLVVDNGDVRKTITAANRTRGGQPEEWLNLFDLASIEITSEHPDYSIEEALACRGGRGWQAAGVGEQQLRLVFERPTPVRRIQLRFTEPAVERTHEFTLRWYGADGSQGLIARQQWNFTPTGSTVEFEDYQVDLKGVCALELSIQPGLNGAAIANLDCWRVA